MPVTVDHSPLRAEGAGSADHWAGFCRIFQGEEAARCRTRAD